MKEMVLFEDYFFLYGDLIWKYGVFSVMFCLFRNK